MPDEKMKKTLSDADIVTNRAPDRRGFMGLMAAGGIVGAAALSPGEAQAQTGLVDSDNGTWTDTYNCGRGSGGVYTGISDADNGSAGTDAGGYGRGARRC